jgi:hypothetical protein
MSPSEAAARQTTRYVDDRLGGAKSRLGAS